MATRYERLSVSEGAVARVLLNRPDKKNALDDGTLQEIKGAFAALSRDERTRCVVLSGAGDDFCAGADIDWMRRSGRLPKAAAKKDAELLYDACLAIDSCAAPVLALVRGNVYGGGLGLLAASDVVFAEENSRFCFSECRLGILPAVVSCFVLPKIGAHARRYYLSAEVFSAQRANEIGLIHEVCSAAVLEGELDKAVQGVLRNGPQAVREAKAMIRRLMNKPAAQRPADAIKTLLKLKASPEGQEGLGAFLEKRAPAWISPR